MNSIDFLNLDFPKYENNQYIAESNKNEKLIKFLVTLKWNNECISFTKSLESIQAIKNFIYINFKGAKNIAIVRFDSIAAKAFAIAIKAKLILDFDDDTVEARIVKNINSINSEDINLLEEYIDIGIAVDKFIALCSIAGGMFFMMKWGYNWFLNLSLKHTALIFLTIPAVPLSMLIISCMLRIIISILALITKNDGLNVAGWRDDEDGYWKSDLYESNDKKIIFIEAVKKLKSLLNEKLFNRFKTAVKKDLNVDIDNVA